MASRQKVDTTQAALSAKPDVQKYKRAQADMVKFAARFYAPPGPMGYRNDNGNPAAAKEATRLAELYKSWGRPGQAAEWRQKALGGNAVSTP